MNFEIDFEEEPRTGDRVVIRKQMFVLARIEPYTRKSDGLSSKLLVWRGTCATCGGEFETTTALKSQSLNKRCALHRHQGKRAR